MPHSVAVFYRYDVEQERIVLWTSRERAWAQHLIRDPRVSLLIESGEVYNELRGVVIYGTAELVRETEDVVEILMKVNRRSIDGMQDANADQIRAAVSGTAPKRTGIRIKPERIVSWDHRKLGGVY